ncbi:MAG: hypothetical protein VW124_14330 [Paracoccaceae bacterium]
MLKKLESFVNLKKIILLLSVPSILLVCSSIWPQRDTGSVFVFEQFYPGVKIEFMSSWMSLSNQIQFLFDMRNDVHCSHLSISGETPQWIAPVMGKPAHYTGKITVKNNLFSNKNIVYCAKHIQSIIQSRNAADVANRQAKYEELLKLLEVEKNFVSFDGFVRTILNFGIMNNVGGLVGYHSLKDSWFLVKIVEEEKTLDFSNVSKGVLLQFLIGLTILLTCVNVLWKR